MNIIKKIIFILLIINISYANNIKSLKFYQSLNVKQKGIMFAVFNKSKEFNLQYTLTSIAWVESHFGKYKINLDDPSCGIFHIVPKTLSNSHWEQSRICERLIKSFNFSYSIALKRFLYFYNYYRSKGYSKKISWKRAICSYNSGWNWRKGLKYYKKVIKTIKILRGLNELGILK